MIVGSAGCLQPLREIVRAVTPDLDAAVVIVTHRSAATPSYLTEILTRTCTAPVVRAINRAVLRPGWVYVTPPGDRHVTVDGQTIRLVAGPPVQLHRPAGDPLFRSAATAFGTRAIGIVLSGMGCDGQAGVAAIARAGGKAFVQLPDEAEWPSMPEHALEGTTPDLCAPAAAIARRVVELCRPVEAEPQSAATQVLQPRPFEAQQ